jgi:outer membrane immunogenic protein
MKRIFLGSFLGTIALAAQVAGPATAADLTRAPPAPAPVYTKAPIIAPYSWTGIYLGGNLGGGWVNKCWTNLGTFSTLSLNEGCGTISGFLGGGQIGGNYQVGAWVLGIEGAGDWSNIKGDHISTNAPADTLRAKVDSIAMVTGRVGYAADSVLFYGKGGVAWAHDKYSEIFQGASFGDATQWRAGWTAGAGIEWGFAPSWSVAFEYDYLGLGTKSVGLVNPTSGTVANFENVQQNINMATVRLNYRLFGGR